jgi:flagellar biosynthesis protein FlhF
MRLKSYFSGSVAEAMAQARQELGEDALLINARPAAPETRSLGAYEVVFGAAPAQEVAQEITVARDLARLERQVAQLTRVLSRPPALASTPAEVACDPTLGRPGAGRAVVALVGPPGAGKTTMLVKLAAHYGLACRRRPWILTADVFRVAAAEQLRSLAAILGIGCDVVETPGALGQALEEQRGRDLVLIDTPGFGACDIEDAGELARFLAAHPEVDTHLVLTASADPEVMARQADDFCIFEPDKLIFTRLDETERLGALAAQAARSGLPLSFFGTGQQIPEDLEAAAPERLAAANAVAPRLARRGAAA